MKLVLHIDEVDDDDPADVPKPELANDLIGSLEVGAKNRLFEIALTDVVSRIDIDGNERLGGVNDNVTARRKTHGASERRIDRRLQVVGLKQWCPVPVEPDSLGQLRRCLLQERDGLVVEYLVVDQEELEPVREHVSDKTQGQVHLRIHDFGRNPLVDLVFHVLPQPKKELEIGNEVLLVHAHRHSPHNHAETVGDMRCDDVVQPVPLGLADLAGNAHELRERHQHQESSGQGDLGTDPRTLGAHRVLQDLQHDLLPTLEQRLDVATRKVLHTFRSNNLVDIEEGVLLQPDVNECSLHPGQDILDLAEVDIAYNGPLRTLDMEFDEFPILEKRNTRLVGIVRDKHLALNVGHATLLSERSPHPTLFLDQGVGARDAPDGSR